MPDKGRDLELWEQVQGIALLHFRVHSRGYLVKLCQHMVPPSTRGDYRRPDGKRMQDVNCSACLATVLTQPSWGLVDVAKDIRAKAKKARNAK